MALLTLWVICTVTFGIMRTIPGGPFSSERYLPPEIEANLAARYNLDRPLLSQYFTYIFSAAQGDLGKSFVHVEQTTRDIIKTSFPASATLGLIAFCLAYTVGVPLGILAATSRSQILDAPLMIFAIAGVSVPGFIAAGLLQYFLGFKLGWLPISGYHESWKQLVLPAVSLSLFPIAFLSRLVRNSMLGVLKTDYMRTARAKGLSQFRATVRHGLRNALLPPLTYGGPLLAGLLTGSFVIENIFAIPGLGYFFVSSINDRDYPVIMGVTLFYSALIIGFNMVTDLFYRLVDPRLS